MNEAMTIIRCNPTWKGRNKAAGPSVSSQMVALVSHQHRSGVSRTSRPTRVGLLVRESPLLCWWLTNATIWLETLGPAALFLPFHVGLQRMIVIASFILFHAGLAL